MRRAQQIVSGEQENFESTTKDGSIKFDCRMSEENKRKFSPWASQKSLTTYLGRKPKCIRSKGKDTFVVEVEGRDGNDKMNQLAIINDCPVEVEEGKDSFIKALVYVNEYNMSNCESYKGKLIELFNLKDVVEANWIKSKHNQTKPLLISFRGSAVPGYIDIPGEQAKTKVYEYKQKTMLCFKCLEFGHRTKFCRGEKKCRKCHDTGHEMEQCSQTESACYHCEGNHMAGSTKCPICRYEEEILAIQTFETKERVPKGQAKLILGKSNPNFRMNFSQALRKQTHQDNIITTMQRKPLTENPKNTSFHLSKEKTASDLA